MRQTEQITIPPLTVEDTERGVQAVEDLRRFREELLARRGGIPFPSSRELINQMRDERTGEVRRGSEERSAATIAAPYPHREEQLSTTSQGRAS